MRVRYAGPVAWSLWSWSVAFAGFGLLFLYLNGTFEDLLDESVGVDVAMTAAFPAVGAIIASRQPGNAVGWIFCAVGLCGGASVFFAQYGVYSLVTNPGSLPAGVISTWVETRVWLPSVTLTITFLLLLFPHGRLLGRRWRPVAWLAAGVTAAGVALLGVAPWDLLDTGVPVRNPFGIESFREVGLAVPLSILAVGIPTMLLCTLSLVLRSRRSRGEERQQLKWFVYAGVLNIGVLLIPGADSSDVVPLLQIATFPLLPVAAGIAILRYRLYDVDVIINQTLVYAALTATLVLVYLGSLVSLQYLFRTFAGGDFELAVVASTLGIAALFNPLRQTIQRFIDRRFYRSKYDATRTLGPSSERLRNETDLGTLRRDLVGVVGEPVAPAHASLWLREQGRAD